MEHRESVLFAVILTGIAVALGNSWPQALQNVLFAYLNYNNPQTEYISPGQTGSLTGIKNG